MWNRERLEPNILGIGGTMKSGEEYDLRAGDVFHISAGHDSWVVGDEPYVSLHLLGASEYAMSSESSRGRSRE